MIPSAVLSGSTTTRTTMKTTLNNNQSVPVRSGDSHSFGICRLTTLGASDATIQIILPVSISILPSYRHTLIARLLFHHHLLFYLTSFLYLPFTCYIDPRLIILRRYNIGVLPFPISLPYFAFTLILTLPLLYSR